MRLLTILVIVLALAWSGYWFVGARALDRAIDTALENARNNGVEVETDALDVTGFPNRFDIMVEAPRVHLPASGITWSAPFLQIFALSYRPNQLIMALPDSQEVTGPFGTATIDTESARASATFQPSMELALDHANLVVEELVVTSAERALSVGQLLAASRIPEGAEDGRVQNIGITLGQVSLPDTMADQLGSARTIDGARLDATVTLSQPITRTSFQGGGVEIESIRIDSFDIDWGDLGIEASGQLDVGADGFLRGELVAELNNWPRALDIAAGMGLVPQDQVAQVRRGLALVSGLSGSDSRIELPLIFRDGQIFLGPVPIGTAPQL